MFAVRRASLAAARAVARSAPRALSAATPAMRAATMRRFPSAARTLPSGTGVRCFSASDPFKPNVVRIKESKNGLPFCTHDHHPFLFP